MMRLTKIFKTITLVLCLSVGESFAKNSKDTISFDVEQDFLETLPLLKNDSPSIEPYKARIVLDSGSDAQNQEILDFDDFVNGVKKYHPVLAQAEMDRSFAKAQVTESLGAFDPSINSVTAYNRYNSTSSPGKELDAFTNQTSIDYQSSFGAKFGLGARFATGDIKTPLNLTGDGGEYFLSLQIPFLRNAFYNEKSVKTKTAKFKESIADYKYFYTKLNLLIDSSEIYWKWFGSKMKLDAEQSLLKIAEGQYEFVSKQVELGNLPQINQIEAEREIKKRLGRVNQQSRDFEFNSLKLSEFLWGKDFIPLAVPNINNVPRSIIEPFSLNRDQIEEAKLNALTKRPEFKILQISKDIANLERKFAKNQMLPILDAFVNPGYEAGDNGIGPVLNAGVNLSLPLRIRFAQGKLKQAETSMQQLNLQERQLIQKLFIEIENEASQINRAFNRYLAAKSEVELAKTVELGEKDRFELGDSTLFLLIQRERSTVEAQLDLVNTISDYHSALAKFKFLQGIF